MPDLDPQDWSEFSKLAHGALDDMITHLRYQRGKPVWQTMPQTVRRSFIDELPRLETPLADVLERFRATIQPYATGNTHPLFFGWVHGAGTPVGLVAEMLAAGLNANCGGRDHVGIAIEQQVTRWAAQLFGFAAQASGVFVTGTSMANLLGVLIARHKALGAEVKTGGVRTSAAALVAYASSEAHSCIARALEVSGLGTDTLRLIATDPGGAMDCLALADTIARDRRAGLHPFLLIGNAGTVNIGAIDPLNQLGDIAQREGMWFHVDGAFGALIAVSAKLRPRLAGIERADSLAFDFHKWAHVPYDAGFLLVRDANIHRATFANQAAYLSRSPDGLGAGETWPCDLGIDLSRGFRALKTWMTFQVLGADRIAAAIEDNCRLASLLAERLNQSALFELAAPAGLNIVCFALKDDQTGRHSEALVIDLQTRGKAAPSLTRLNGRLVIRAAIVNHRSTEADIEDFLVSLQSSALRLIVEHARDTPPGEARHTA